MLLKGGGGIHYTQMEESISLITTSLKNVNEMKSVSGCRNFSAFLCIIFSRPAPKSSLLLAIIRFNKHQQGQEGLMPFLPGVKTLQGMKNLGKLIH